MNGDPQIKEKVKEKANLWMNDANLKFEYVGDGEADIRIGFKEIDPVTQKPDTGSWSYLGMDALTIPKNKATMNFGWLEQDTSDEEYNEWYVMNLVMHLRTFTSTSIHYWRLTGIRKKYINFLWDHQTIGKRRTLITIYLRDMTSQLRNIPNLIANP